MADYKYEGESPKSAWNTFEIQRHLFQMSDIKHQITGSDLFVDHADIQFCVVIKSIHPNAPKVIETLP